MRLSTEHRDFQFEIREFIRQNLPADIKTRVEADLYLRKSDHVRWQKVLHNAGYFPPALSKEHGGAEWSVMQRFLFDRENGLGGAPWIIPYGVSMVAPVLLNFGSQEQIAQYLPGILSSDTWWCQGYSEPNSGSDLASLSCKAIRDGDHYVINGTKMWTTQAHYADMMHMLVRTDDSGRKQQGITFLLVDMNTPGIEISPIVTIDGLHHTNQLFLDNVRVPVTHRVGAEGDGWTIAKFLLSHERASVLELGWKLRSHRLIGKFIARQAEAGIDRDTIMAYKMRWAQLGTEISVLEEVAFDMIAGWAEGDGNGHDAAVLKIRATEIEQELSHLALELHDPYGIVLDSGIQDDDFLDVQSEQWRYGAGMSYQYLRARAATVYGGTNEIQRSIIAGSILK